MLRTPPDGFSASNITARMLIANAYDVKEDQVTGGPAWVASTGYDIDAKVTAFGSPDVHQLTSDQRRQMLQSLLADRFQLAVHTETKQAPIYELTIAKGGPKLKPSDTSAAPAAPPPGAGLHGNPGDGPPRGGMMRMSGPGNLNATAMSMPQFVEMLSRQLHTTIVDKTGLTGSYDLSLAWTPDDMPASPAGAETPDPSGPSIFTALQEQLGLKLSSTRGPVKTIVIDHITPPTEN